MKARLRFLAPGLALVAFQALLWALGAPASHVSTLLLSIGFTALLSVVYDEKRRADRAADLAEDVTARYLTTTRYLRKVLNAQTATIARLQAMLYRRNRR